MKDKFIEVQIAFNNKNYDRLYSQLYLNGIENILEEDGVLKVYFGKSKSGEIETLRESLLSEGLIKEKDFTSEEFEDKNWNQEWEKTIEPVKIRNKIIVYPSWRKNELANSKDKILIEIDPKMSFGTGHNETTQLVLELMCDNLKGDELKLLDFGCGTGILAIAAVKMGIQHAVAIDIDDDSISNAAEYIDKNSVGKNIKLLKTGIDNLDEVEFDVICANIIRSVITDNFEHIKEKLNDNGKLFLSGILNTEDQTILELLFQNDFEVIDILNKSEWIGIYAIKR